MALGDRTYMMTVDNTQKWPIVTTVICEEVWFYEAKSAATQDFSIYEPFQTSSSVDKVRGDKHVFRNGRRGTYEAGVTIGYVQLDAGSFVANVEQK